MREGLLETMTPDECEETAHKDKSQEQRTQKTLSYSHAEEPKLLIKRPQ